MLVVIQLGSGNLQEGFPLITAQLWESHDALPQQFTGSLPASPHLQVLSQSWQALYRALCDSPFTSSDSLRKSNQHRSFRQTNESEFEIDDGGIQQVSSFEFEELCQSLSQQFNQWLGTVEFSSIDRPLRSHLSVGDSIRIILATQDDQIRRLPWQRWDFLQDYPKAELALSLTQYRRQSQTSAPSHQFPRILAILGNSQDIDLTAEQQLLSQLEPASVEFLVEPSREQVHQALWDSRGWDLLFFAGHSSSESSTVGRLFLNQNSTLKQNSLTIDELSEALSAALNYGLKFAIFNSCDGLGLANQLAVLNIPQVIVMREPVPNRVAQKFFQSFLTAYVRQLLPLYEAIKQARRQLQGLEADFPGASWLPILCQNPAEKPLDWQELCQVPSQDFSPSIGSSLPQQDYRDRQIFLNKIRNAWIKGVLHKSLPSQAMLTMGLVEQPDLIQNPAVGSLELSMASYPLPPGTNLVDYFESLGLGRSLLLLGEPGAGKTIALLDLAQHLLRRADQENQLPMPVVLNLSDWRLLKKTRRPISQWLVQSLLQYYQVPPVKTESWLQLGQLTLLLDGLDELPSLRQAQCIEAINRFRQEYPQVEMVLCCRSAVYESIGVKASMQAALMLQPLSLGAITDYCNNLGDVGQKVKVLLGSDDPLQMLATSPLMLNIMLLAADEMEGTGTSSLLQMAQDSPQLFPSFDPLADRRHRLLNAYINRMLARRSQRDITPAEIISNLRFLAQKMHHSNKSVFQIESIQPDWLPTRLRAWHYPILLGVSLNTMISVIPIVVAFWLGGSWMALAIFISWSLIGGAISGFIGGWLGGFTGGLIGGGLSTIWLWTILPNFSLGLVATPILTIFMSFLFGFCRDYIEPLEQFFWSWKKARSGFLMGVGVGLFLSVPLFLGNTTEGRVMTPIVAFLFMLFQGFSKRSHLTADKAKPNEGIWQTAKNAVQIGALSTVIFGVLSWMILALNTSGDWASFGPSLQASLPFAAIAGGIMGIGMGLIGAEGSGVVCIQHFVLRVLLWQQGLIPWNYAKFLDDCANRILLQKVGGSYIFPHRILLEHFADWRPS